MDGGIMEDEEAHARNLVLSLSELKFQGEVPTPRIGARAVSHHNKIIMFGGMDEKGPLGELHLLEAEKLKWSELAAGGFSKPSPRYGHSFTLSGTTAFLFGGLTLCTTINFEHNLGQDAPEPSASFSNKHRHVAAISFTDRLFGERQEEIDNELYILDINKVVWSQPICTGQSPGGRYMHSASVVGNKYIIFGGCAEPDYTSSLDDMYVLTIANESYSWSKPLTSGAAPSSRHGHGTTATSANTMLLFGGAIDIGDCLRLMNDVHVLNTDTWVWSIPNIKGTPPMARAFHSVDLVNNRVLVCGGETSITFADLYALDIKDPNRMRWERPLSDTMFDLHLHASAALHDKLLVYGGLDENLKNDIVLLNVLEIKHDLAVSDFKFKVVLVGDSGVGKSCLLTRFVEDVYADFHVATIGVDFKTVMTMIKGKVVKLQIWDTAGQERFSTVTGNYYRNADGFVFVYDATNLMSFQHIDRWVEEVRKVHEMGPSTTRILIGNKHDVEHTEVTEDMGEQLAARIGAVFVPTSAKTAANVDGAFLGCAKKLVEIKQRQVTAPKKADDSIRVGFGSAVSQPEQGGCCGSTVAKTKEQMERENERSQLTRPAVGRGQPIEPKLNFAGLAPGKPSTGARR
eukprot:GILJ01006416.1.p1 GENE.GILJ01006416.1~~GILJ01006416.1.p1  ORF type:complete len:649 (-),score=92.42 GILJ01006416.1:463-2349(-)